MSNVISSTNVLETLIQLEQNGYKFYQEAANAMEEGVTKNLLLKLAKDEQAHEKVYKELLEKQTDISEISINEDETYINLILKLNSMVTDEKKIEKMKKVTSKREALITGEKLEKDTIIFLNELVNLDKDIKRNNAYRTALKEEKNHLRLILRQMMDENINSLML
jgi:rubrerythrin